MSKINRETSVQELAAIVSQALEAAGISATLSGGGAVRLYSSDLYISNDLDFVTSAGRELLKQALEPLGFKEHKDGRHFTSEQTDLYIEFPPAPLQFGHLMIQAEELPIWDTPWGPLRIVTPTLCVMDRLVAYWHWSDRQSWDQAVLVVRHQEVDRGELVRFARGEQADVSDIERLFLEAMKNE